MATAASLRVRRVQTISLVLLVTTGVVNYVDRATLAVASPLIRQDLGLSIPDMGLLLSAFLWAYAFAQLPAGAIADRLGPRLTLTIGLSCWSLGQMLGGAVTSFWQFVGARIVLGLGEAPHFPTCARVSRDWFNIRQRGTATGIWNCASSLGTFLALPLLTALMVGLGWRAMFVIMGAAGLALAGIVYLVFRNPPEVNLTPAERAFLEEGDAPEADRRVTWSAWKRLYRYRTSWGMIVGYFGCIYMTWLYTAWLPSYLEIERHFTLQKTGIIGAIPFAFGVLGGILGGRVVDLLVRRGVDPIRSRKIPMVSALLATAAFTVVAALTPSDTLAMACISASLFLVYISSSAAWAMASVAAPANCTASLGAMQNFGGYIGGALAPTVTGFIVGGTGHFSMAFITGAVIALVAAIGYWTLIQEPIAAEAQADHVVGSLTAAA
ncbi:MFS transporter [Methylobacterium sp. NEAU K]|uniref:MFS transporter n=1 Tax=Methylobacterium sp. NEAU K TaxID=3064946 RepID=UPI002735C9A8|nr:MFS transporter [Methylobacterium sp. NEAU K]MDP4004354.1 MFS transporter [Methylobacterium sp. NEAU K]